MECAGEKNPRWYKKIEPRLNNMRVFLLFEGMRSAFEIPRSETINYMKRLIQEKFLLGTADGKPDKRIMILSYAGAELADDWCLSDIGVQPNATIKVVLREEVRPTLCVYCPFNQETIKILDAIDVNQITVGELRTVIMNKTGLPVGVFRVVNKNGDEMYDCNKLHSYGVERGHTVRLETWDGWKDFLNLSFNGYTSHVLTRLSTEEPVAKYQHKVALFLAAHYGHVDLAVTLLRLGVRADEPVGNHPYRQWCTSTSHIDTMKTPIHQAAQKGQIGPIRTFVTNDITVISAKDGNGLKPLNVALRSRQPACASYLLTKHWSKVVYEDNVTIPVNVYIRMKFWCEQAKDRIWFLFGAEKSSCKRRPNRTGALVGQGVHIDGFTKSNMTSSPREGNAVEMKNASTHDGGNHKLNPDVYFKREATKQFKLPSMNKWNRMAEGKSHSLKPILEQKGQLLPNSKSMTRPVQGNRTVSENNVNVPRLPPLEKRSRKVSQSASDLVTILSEPCTGEAEEETTEDLRMKNGRTLTATSPVDDDIKASERRRINLFKTTVDKKRKERNVRSAILLAKTNKSDVIPLPVISMDSHRRPFFHQSRNGENLVLTTLELYEKYRGIRSRDYAVNCLTIASNFKEKPWLHQVRLAMDLTKQRVQGLSKGSNIFK